MNCETLTNQMNKLIAEGSCSFVQVHADGVVLYFGIRRVPKLTCLGRASGSSLGSRTARKLCREILYPKGPST